MSQFGEQLQNRIDEDSYNVSHVLMNLVDAVSTKGRFHAREHKSDNIQNEVIRICNYFKLEPDSNIPKSTSVNGLIDHLVRRLGIMRRRILLEDDWWKNGFGPLLATKLDSDSVLALLPGRFGGYYYFDSSTSAYVKITARNKDQFAKEALCFYRPLPDKPLNGQDLVLYLLRNISTADIVAVVVALAFIAISGIIIPLVTRIIFANILPSRREMLLLSSAVFLSAAAIHSFLFTSVNTAAMSSITNQMDTILQNGLIARMLSLPAKFFSDKTSGELSQSIGALTLLPNILSELFFGTGTMAIISLIYVIQIAFMVPLLSLPALVTYALEIILIVVCIKQKSTLIKQQLTADRKSQGLVFQLFSGIQKIKLSGSENRAFAKWGTAYKDKVMAAYNWPFPVFMQNELLVFIQMLGLMASYVIASIADLPKSDYIVFTTSYGMIMSSLSRLLAGTDMMAYLDPVLAMGNEILQAVPENSPDRKTIDHLDGVIELKNVSFHYEQDGPKILDGISLKVDAGEYIAIVGKSGCGKSTLMRLLLGFEDPDEGSIYYGQDDLKTLDLASVRRNIGTVLQNGRLFMGSVYSNITISAPELSMDDAWEAARMAGIADDIDKMPMGMHTIISEGSGGISGGQRQRLMIARAIAPKPNILMFDEATSALDNLTQKTVADSLAGLKCTRIVIAHRLSTIKKCDRIIVLDGGKIIENGTYDKLIADDGFFAELVRRQQVDVVEDLDA